MRAPSARMTITAGALSLTTGFGLALLPSAAGVTQTTSTADGHAATGSGLGTIETAATSYVIRAPLYSSAGEDVEAEAPYATSSLGAGGVGSGLTSIFWPGDTGAYGGEVLDLLNINQIPESIKKQLNDPEKAEAQTGVGASTVTKKGAGFTMTATATETHVSSATTAAGSAIPAVGKFTGTSDARTAIREIGPKAVTVTADSTLHNLSIAGIVKIGSVTTTAKAVTRAITSTARTKTVVAGASVAGIPVSIDNTGIHVDKKLLPADPLVNPDKLVNAALAQSGISLRTTRSVTHIKGAMATATSGALRLNLGNASYDAYNGTGTVLIIGGVTLSADSTPGYPMPSISPSSAPPASPPVTASTPIASHPPTTHAHHQPVAVVPPAGPSTGPIASQPAVSPVVAPSPTTAPVTVADVADVSLPGGLKVWWVVCFLLGSGLIAFGLKRLPDRIFDGSSTPCAGEQM